MKKCKWTFLPFPKDDIYAKFQLSELLFGPQLLSAVISCHLLLTDDYSYYTQKIKRNFHLHHKRYASQILHLQLHFHFHQQQLLTADDGCFKKKYISNFHLPPKAVLCVKFKFSRLIGGQP